MKKIYSDMVSKKVFEYKEFIDSNLYEQAQMTYKNELFVQDVGTIYVVGGGYNGKQREHGIPHFKLVKNNGEELRIVIPQKKVNKITIDDIFILDKRELDRNEKKLLLNWLKDNSKRAKIVSNIDRTNLIHIVTQWNELNFDDNNVQQIPWGIYV